jgi:hypothetical protein
MAMVEQMSKEQKFLMLVQTAAIVKELSGEAEEIKKIRNEHLAAHSVLGAAMEVFQYVPNSMDVADAADQFLNYVYSKEPVPTKPEWVLPSGL